MTVTLRVGPQAPQDALWARRGDNHEWRADADRTAQLLREEALDETLRILTEFAAGG
ncbi:MAG: hypothetical protein ABI427_08920 [Solirubrobacteraceae bacterium]